MYTSRLMMFFFTLWVGTNEHISKVPLGHVWQGTNVVSSLEKKNSAVNQLSACHYSNSSPTFSTAGPLFWFSVDYLLHFFVHHTHIFSLHNKMVVEKLFFNIQLP